ncbi:hypothetical protein AOLI_G00188130 [Acnodon oligacanthus]
MALGARRDSDTCPLAEALHGHGGASPMSAARLGIRHVSLLGTISARRMVRRAAAPKPCGSRREHHMRLLAQRERRALKPSLPFTLMLRLKPAPPFTLMLRLGRSQGSCQDGPRN